MKQYKAIFFDWDGTAVLSRKAPTNQVALLMKKLLQKGVCLAVISGTTIENIGGGKLHEAFTTEEQKNLFYGLGRGAYNYHFTGEGQPEIFLSLVPDRDTMLKVHRACYEVHERLFRDYGFPTDVIFSRPNYCKIDLMVENQRGDNLFFQDNELDCLKNSLRDHGITTGLSGLLDLAVLAGERQNIKLSATTDAKYLEAGLSSKSDNVNAILSLLKDTRQILPEECCFWGDEYVGMDEELFGSDSFMITDSSLAGDFFDVSDSKGKRPDIVRILGGGVDTFLKFLEDQGK